MKNELTFIFAFHIIVGTLALLAGAAALIYLKGSKSHRLAGKFFVITMALMSITGAVLAFRKPAYISVVAGSLTFYLVASAWITVWRKAGETGSLEVAGLVLVALTAIGGFALGLQAANSDLGYTLIDGFKLHPVNYYFFGVTATVCAALDIRLLIYSGISGAHRIARHLWRMCFAMYIAAASIFIGNPQVFPESIQGSLVLSAPVIAIFLLMIFWLVRVYYLEKKKAPPNWQGF